MPYFTYLYIFLKGCLFKVTAAILFVRFQGWCHLYLIITYTVTLATYVSGSKNDCTMPLSLKVTSAYASYLIKPQFQLLGF